MTTDRLVKLGRMAMHPKRLALILDISVSNAPFWLFLTLKINIKLLAVSC